MASNLVKPQTYSDSTKKVLQIYPYGTNTLSNTGSNIVTFLLPREDFLLGSDLTLQFQCTVDGDAASDDKLMDNVACIWRSLRVTIGGETVQYIQEIGHLQSITDNLQWDSSYSTSFAAICSGYPALAVSGTAQRYSMRFLHNSFLSNIIPCGKLSEIKIELELNQNLAQYTTATTAVTSISVTNMTLRCPFLKSAELEAQYSANDVEISFDDYVHFRDTNITSGDTSYTLTIPTSNKSLDGVLIAMRATADVADPNLSGTKKYTQNNLTNALTKFQFELDGQAYPSREIDATNQIEMYENLLEYAGRRKGNNYSSPSFFTKAGFTAATSSQFLIGYSFKALSGSTNTVSGLDTASRTGQLLAKFTSMTASSDTQIDTFVRYTKLCKFNKNGGLLSSSR